MGSGIAQVFSPFTFFSQRWWIRGKRPCNGEGRISWKHTNPQLHALIHGNFHYTIRMEEVSAKEEAILVQGFGHNEFVMIHKLPSTVGIIYETEPMDLYGILL